MKKILIIALVALSANLSASAQSSLSGFLSNLVEGVFSTSNIEVSDLAGVWTVDGSAVSFKSESLLQKAGGIATASALEAKIDPYFTKYGFTGGTITIQSDGTVQMVLKKLTLNGTITKQSDGNFTLSFTVLGRSISSLTTYITKTSTTMDIMFEGKKLQSLISTVGSLSGISTVKTLTSLLTSYDGMYVGFGTTKSGTVSTSTTTTTTTNTSTNTQNLDSLRNNVSNGVQLLKGLFGK
jgi:hypothetical protein